MIPLRDNIPSRTFPVVNYALIIINSAIFLYEVSLGPQLEAFLHTFGVIPAKYFWLAQHEPWNIVERFFPILTSMFLHGGWLHIIGNMWFLWIFGDNVEDRMGHGRYLAFYILSGIGASLFHIYLNPTSTVPTIGASGAIAGVMGAYFILYPFARVITLVPIFIFVDIIEIPAFFFLGFWVLLQFFQGTLSLAFSQSGGVAWWAHFGGFLVGAVLVFFFKKPRKKMPRVYPDQFFPW
ncbi:MAG: rhomboid family intramembrane serine protease [Calditrichaeota bacterium]|nr:rhomboid family intramembrane serine protease [Calditrichota bacterium]